MASPLNVPAPYGLTWNEWASATVVAALGVYTLPNPGDEGSWQAWATELLTVVGLAGEGSVDPRAFGEDWKDWAAAFTVVAS